MNDINIICEVNAALYNLINTNDASLHSKVLANLSNALKPVNTELADRTQTVASMQLICLFGEETETIEAAEQLDLDFSAPFKILGAWYESGLMVGTSYDENGDIVGTATYDVVLDGDGCPDLFKYANPIDGVAYKVVWLAMKPSDQAKANPFWSSTHFRNRKYL